MVTVKKTKDEQSSRKEQVTADKTGNQNYFQCGITKTNTHGKFCSYDGVIGWICRHDPERIAP